MSRFTLKKMNGKFIVTRGISIRKEFYRLKDAWKYIADMTAIRNSIRRTAV